MAQLDLFLRLALAAVFALAGVGKLVSGDVGNALEAFSLPRRLAPLVRAVPLVELAVAAALIVPATARAGALASSALLLVFSTLLVRNLVAGRQGSCNCFGSRHGSEAGWTSLLRNALLLAGSAAVLASGSEPGWRLVRRDLHVVGAHALVAGAVAAVAAIALLVALRSRRSAAPAPAHPASTGDLPAGIARQLTTLEGGALAGTAADAAGSDLLLVFVDPHCGPCRSVVPSLRTWWDQVPPGAVLVVTRGDPAVNREVLAGLPPDRVVFDPDGELAAAYGVLGTPSGVLLPAGAGARTLVTGPAAIEVLLRHLAQASPRHGRAAHRSTRRRRVPALVTGDGRTITALSRREVFRAAGAGAGLALAAAACGSSGKPSGNGSAGGGATSSTGTQAGSNGQCPSCGTCYTCQLEGTPGGTPTMTCTPCTEKCSAASLCTSNAITSSDYNALASYLGSEGYTRQGEPIAIGFWYDGSIQSISLLSAYAGSSGSALLTYWLTNNGGSSGVVFTDADKTVDSYATVSSSGTVVRTQVTTKATGATGATGTTGTSSSVAGNTGTGQTGSAGAGLTADVIGQAGPGVVLMGSKCENTCGFYLGALSLVLSATAEIVTSALLGGFAFGAVGMMLVYFVLSQVGALWPATGSGVPGVSIGSMWNMMAKQELLGMYGEAGALASILPSILRGLLCKAWCALLACCNFSGTCFPSMSACNAACPTGLAHPDALCEVKDKFGNNISQFFPF